MIMKAQHILVRVYPCTCGCKGKDPHHQASYTRNVTDIEETPDAPVEPFGAGTALPGFNTSPSNICFKTLRVGYVKLPHGRAKVHQKVTADTLTGKHLGQPYWKFIEYV